MAAMMRLGIRIVCQCLFLCIGCVYFASILHAESLVNVQLNMNNGTFTPSMIIVPVGRKLKITVRNTGNTAAEFESISLRKEKVLAPGAQSFIVIAPLRAGQYSFFDDFHLDMPHGVIVAR